MKHSLRRVDWSNYARHALWAIYASFCERRNQEMFSKLSVVVVAMLAVGLAVPAAAFACDPHDNDGSRTALSHDYVNGWVRGLDGGITWEDAESNILVKDPYVYDDLGSDNKGNFSWGFVMLQTDSGCCWAQVGPSKQNDRVRYNFTQCYNPETNGGVPDDVFTDPATVGDTPTYKIENKGDGKYFYENGSMISYCAYTFTPAAIDLGTEIWNRRDQVQGTVASPGDYTSSTAHDGSGASYDILESGEYGSSPSWMNVNKVSSTEMEGWDGDCPS